MSYRSDVAFGIEGPKDKLEFLREWAEDLFSATDLMPANELQLWVQGPDTEIWMLCWECSSIKWYDEYVEIQQFKLLWGLAEKWGLNGTFVEIGESGDHVEKKDIGIGIPDMYPSLRIMTPW